MGLIPSDVILLIHIKFVGVVVVKMNQFLKCHNNVCVVSIPRATDQPELQ